MVRVGATEIVGMIIMETETAGARPRSRVRGGKRRTGRWLPSEEQCLSPFVSSPQTLPVSVRGTWRKEKARGMFLLEMNFGSFSQDFELKLAFFRSPRLTPAPQ